MAIWTQWRNIYLDLVLITSVGRSYIHLYGDWTRNESCRANETHWVVEERSRNWQQAALSPGAADTVRLRPRTRTQLHRPLQLAVAVNSACSIGVPILKFLTFPFARYDTLLVSAVIELDLLTLKLACIIARGTEHTYIQTDGRTTDGQTPAIILLCPSPTRQGIIMLHNVVYM